VEIPFERASFSDLHSWYEPQQTVKSLIFAAMGVGICLLVDACSAGDSLRVSPHANADAAADTGHKQDAAEPDRGIDLRTVDEPGSIDLRIVADAPGADQGIDSDATGKDASLDSTSVDNSDAQEADLPRAGCAGSFSGGFVWADLTFTKACSPYVIESWMDISESASLVIEAGTVVLFARGTSVFVNGRLDIRGTQTDPVVLDAYSANPAPGDWSALRFSGTPASPSQIRYATIRNCGWANDGCVWTYTSTARLVTLDHVTISDSVDAGFVAPGGGSAPQAPIGFSMTNCTFRNIPKGAFAARTHAQEFTGIGSGNDFGGFPVAIDGGWISVDTAWTSLGTDIVVTQGSINVVRSGSVEQVTLSLGAGMKFLFNRITGIYVSGYNRLEVRGTADAPVVFSSNAPSPKPGDWDGIDVPVSSGGRAGINLSHAVIEYAGGGSERRGGILLYETSYDAVVTDSVIRQNAGQGIYLSCYASTLPVLTGTTFESNASDINQTGAVADNVGPGPSGTQACPTP
jgi:hypothetical protein